MAILRRLPDGLVDRIAAGEVIERPAAAVKELVENAIDAGARRIAVVLANGGIDRIEVTDDGSGMPPEALALAIQRHCTSKLADDHLIRITTLGFRGEALPSIGAAARLQITSRPPGAPHAHRIRVEGGVAGPVAPAAGPLGTQVLVSDLFFATPARRNFLKSARVEADHAETAVRRLAFAAPHVALRLVSDGRTIFDLPSQDRAARATALLGAGELLLVDGERGGLLLRGHAGGPAASRATTAGQSLVVNNRPVTDPVLRTAVRVAYRDVIASGRHATVALCLTVPAEEVDVNVHPAKTELRFRDPDAVRGLVIGTLRRCLAGGAGTAPRLASFRPGPARPPLRLVAPAPAAAPGFAETVLPFAPAARAVPPPDAPSPHPLGAAVAQVLDTYVIAVAGDGSLVLVDQHAAHERLTHEALAAQLREWRGAQPAAAAARRGGFARRGRRLPAAPRAGPGVAGAGAGSVRPRCRAGARRARGAVGRRRAGPGTVAARPGRRAGGAWRGHRAGRPAGRGGRPHGLPRQRARRPPAEPGGNERPAAPDGGDAARRHLLAWPAHGAEAQPGRDRNPVRPALRCGKPPTR